MTHLDTEIQDLKSDVLEMWSLVINQLTNVRTALIDFDKELANEINVNEKRVDAFELKLNMDCEKILALFNPVAIDLRFVLAALKINYNLERIGDYANGISHIVMDSEKPFCKDLIKETRIIEMFDASLKMLSGAYDSFEKENKHLVAGLFKEDKKLDEININANKMIAGLIKQSPDCVDESLHLLSVIRKLERVGDQTVNIAEEIIFFIEAKVLKHQKLKKQEKS
ncbi:MAG TPA: phosphate signaling complex protein PhoU [Bacteroidales bacterium]|nr:phosphate signaling complex protein PhoU [Bacteroidales bacterium]